MERRLAAILAADMVGFSRQMQDDEVRTLESLNLVLTTIVEPEISAHRGRIFKKMGDGFLAEFASAVDALNCARAIQTAIHLHNQPETPGEQVVFRMGLNIGDIILENDDVFGDGVNIAARLEPLAPAGGIVVADTVHDQLWNKADVGFEPLGSKQLKNIADPVDVYLVVPEPVAERRRNQSPTAALPKEDVPVLAILPFENMSADPDQEFLADGIAEDLISSLSQIGHLSVTPRSSVFTFKGRAATVQEIGDTLGARFVVTGSLRKSTDRIRVSVQLADAQTGSHMWSNRYDRQLDDIFAVQDEITLTVATALQVELTEGEQALLRYTSTNNVEAWTEFIRGLSYFRTVHAESYRHARACFERAREHDPESAQIMAMLACTLAIEGRFHWSVDRDDTLLRAKTIADQALEIDPKNADAWAALGYWHMAHMQLEESVAAYGRAAELAPEHADLRALSALALTFAERPEEAIREVQSAIRLNPLGPGWYFGILGHAYRYAGRYDEALTVLSEYNDRSTGFGLVDMVLTCADMGDMDGARSHGVNLLAARPEFTVENWALTQNCLDPDRLTRDRASLVDAGLP
ncbi:MAG: adenylate/guanylate cyclase domain-containing protein [Alphaproteobacteria bacterium]